DRHAAAVEGRDVADDDVAAELQRDRLVAFPGIGFPAVADPACTVDPTRAADGDVMQVLTPDQTVVPVAVRVVLVRIARSRLGRVVALSESGRGGEQRGARREVQSEVALQADRVAGVRAGREVDGAARPAARVRLS